MIEITPEDDKIEIDVCSEMEKVEVSVTHEMITYWSNKLQEYVESIRELAKNTYDYIERALAEKVQSDWNQSDEAEKSFIKHKPFIPTDTNELVNSAGFITLQEIPEYTAGFGIDITDNVISNTLDISDKANTSLSNLSQTGEKHFLNKNQITNCIIEMPKRLKWVTESDALVLKAGSQLMYPDGLNGDGSKKFSYYTTTSDIRFGANTTTTLRYLWVNRGNGISNNYSQDMLYAGPTAPSTFASAYKLWYDTANNTLKYTIDSGSTWYEEGTFPFMTAYSHGTHFDYPHQIFENMGILDSVAWIADGVKALIPNGINEDGTLNNISVMSKASVYIASWGVSVATTSGFCINSSGGIINNGLSYTVSDTVPTTNYTIWYNPKTNTTHYKGDASSSWVTTGPYACIGFCQGNYGQPYASHFSYTEANFKQPVSLVGSQELPSLVDKYLRDNSSSIRYVTTSYVNGASWYRVWSDGWIEQGGLASYPLTITFLKPFKDTSYRVTMGLTGTSMTGYEPVTVQNKTTTTIKITQLTKNYSGTADWYACGY